MRVCVGTVMHCVCTVFTKCITCYLCYSVCTIPLCRNTLCFICLCLEFTVFEVVQDAFIVPIKSKPKYHVLCVVWVCAVFTVCIFNGHFLLSEVYFVLICVYCALCY